MKRVKNDPEGFGPNPADNPKNEYDEPTRGNGFWKQPSSAKAKRDSTELRKRTSAKRAAIRKMRQTGLIPASPTK